LAHRRGCYRGGRASFACGRDSPSSGLARIALCRPCSVDSLELRSERGGCCALSDGVVRTASLGRLLVPHERLVRGRPRYLSGYTSNCDIRRAGGPRKSGAGGGTDRRQRVSRSPYRAVTSREESDAPLAEHLVGADTQARRPHVNWSLLSIVCFA